MNTTIDIMLTWFSTWLLRARLGMTDRLLASGRPWQDACTP